MKNEEIIKSIEEEKEKEEIMNRELEINRKAEKGLMEKLNRELQLDLKMQIEIEKQKDTQRKKKLMSTTLSGKKDNNTMKKKTIEKKEQPNKKKNSMGKQQKTNMEKKDSKVANIYSKIVERKFITYKDIKGWGKNINEKDKEIIKKKKEFLVKGQLIIISGIICFVVDKENLLTLAPKESSFKEEKENESESDNSFSEGEMNVKYEDFFTINDLGSMSENENVKQKKEENKKNLLDELTQSHIKILHLMLEKEEKSKNMQISVVPMLDINKYIRKILGRISITGIRGHCILDFGVFNLNGSFTPLMFSEVAYNYFQSKNVQNLQLLIIFVRICVVLEKFKINKKEEEKEKQTKMIEGDEDIYRFSNFCNTTNNALFLPIANDCFFYDANLYNKFNEIYESQIDTLHSQTERINECFYIDCLIEFLEKNKYQIKFDVLKEELAKMKQGVVQFDLFLGTDSNEKLLLNKKKMKNDEEEQSSSSNKKQNKNMKKRKSIKKIGEEISKPKIRNNKKLKKSNKKSENCKEKLNENEDLLESDSTCIENNENKIINDKKEEEEEEEDEDEDGTQIANDYLKLINKSTIEYRNELKLFKKKKKEELLMLEKNYKKKITNLIEKSYN